MKRSQRLRIGGRLGILHGYPNRFFHVIFIGMKPQTNTAAFRIVLTLSAVWVLGAGFVSYQRFNTITSAPDRELTDNRMSLCSDSSIIGTKTEAEVQSCLLSIDNIISGEVSAERRGALWAGLKLTVWPPLSALILCAYWTRLFQSALLIGRSYVRWVRGAPRS